MCCSFVIYLFDFSLLVSVSGVSCARYLLYEYVIFHVLGFSFVFVLLPVPIEKSTRYSVYVFFFNSELVCRVYFVYFYVFVLLLFLFNLQTHAVRGGAVPEEETPRVLRELRGKRTRCIRRQKDAYCAPPLEEHPPDKTAQFRLPAPKKISRISEISYWAPD